MASVIIIPTPCDAGAAPFDQRMVLDGVPFGLRFQWSSRGQVWQLSLFEDGGAQVLGCVAIRNGVPLLQAYRNLAGLPRGEFIALASTFPEIDAYRGDLGGRVVLHYAEAG